MYTNSCEMNTRYIRKSCIAFIFLKVVFFIVCTKCEDCGNLVDLSYGYDENSPSWPNTEPFKFTKRIAQINEKGNFWYASNEFCLGEHGGTHMDAPYHFNKNGWKISEIPLKNLMNKGIFLDLEKKTKRHQENTTLEKLDLENWERNNKAQIPQDAIVLVRFGWGKHYKNNKYYHGDYEDEDENYDDGNNNSNKNNTNLRFPGISADAARFLVARKISGVGVDTASVDPGITDSFDTHRILSAANIFGMENLNLTSTADCLRNVNFTVVALPMKIVEGTGSPLRIVAIL